MENISPLRPEDDEVWPSLCSLNQICWRVQSSQNLLDLSKMILTPVFGNGFCLLWQDSSSSCQSAACWLMWAGFPGMRRQSNEMETRLCSHPLRSIGPGLLLCEGVVLHEGDLDRVGGEVVVSVPDLTWQVLQGLRQPTRGPVAPSRSKRWDVQMWRWINN